MPHGQDVTLVATELLEKLKDQLGDNCRHDEHRYMTLRPQAKLDQISLVDREFRLEGCIVWASWATLSV